MNRMLTFIYIILLQLAGAKEGDYIVSIQNVDCKWLTVSEVMKLLKGFGEDDIEMKVVSLLDSTSSMVSADTPGSKEQSGVKLV